MMDDIKIALIKAGWNEDIIDNVVEKFRKVMALKRDFILSQQYCPALKIQ